MGGSRHWATAAVLAVVLGGVPGLGDTPARGEEPSAAATRRYAVAAGFQNRGLAKLAADEWRGFLAEFPNDPRRDQARQHLGTCLLQDGQLDAAIAEFKALLGSAPKSEHREAVALNLGVALFRRGRETKAPADVRAAAETFAGIVRDFPRSPLVPRALFNQAETAYDSGAFAEAAAGYERLIKDHPQSELVADATFALGVAQEQLKQPEKAAATFAAFLARFPTHGLAPECRLRKAETAFALKAFAESEALFAQASQVKESRFADYALLRRAGCLHEMGKTIEAADQYLGLPKTFPNSPYRAQALLAAGKCLYLKERYAQARGALGQVAAAADTAGPEAGEAAYWAGRCLLKEKKPADALAAFEAALAAKPHSAARPLLMFGRADATAALPDRSGEAAARYLEFARAFPDDPQTAQALSQAAFAALGAGQLDLARAHATECLTRFPKHALRPEALFALAETELRARHYPEAAARYRAVVEESPQSPHAEEARVRRGLALSLQGQKDEEVIAVLSADLPHLKDKALRAHAQLLIGRAQADRGRFDPAIGALKAALEARADFPLADETRLVLAHCYRATNRPADAANELQRLTTEFPKSPILDQGYLQLGECVAELNQHDRALAAYREAVRRASGGPSAARAQLGIGRTLYRKGDPKGALEALDVLVRTYPASDAVPRGRYVRALAEHALTLDARAIEDVAAFLATGPKGEEAVDARFLKGLCEAAAGRHPEAVATLSSLMKDHPQSPRATQVAYELGFSQRALKRDRDAAETFRKVATANPSGPLAADSWFRVGESDFDAGRFDEAAKDYTEALAKTSDPALKENALHKLGWCAYKRGDFAAALATFDRQTTEFPGGPLVNDGRYLAADAAFKRQDWSSARDRFLKVAAAKPPAYHARALYRAGQCDGQLKDWAASRAHAKELLAAFPKFEQAPEARYGLGWALQNEGHSREAIDVYTQVTRETDTETAAKAQFMIGECLFAEKDHAEAARQFLKAAYGYPYEEWAGNAHFEAARCFEVLRQLDQARESYRALATKYPKHDKAKPAAARLKELGG